MIIDDIKKKLEEDLRVCEAATEGPWELAPDDHEYTVRQIEVLRDGHSGIISCCFYPKANATFTARARAALPRNTRALMKALEALDAAQKVWHSELCGRIYGPDSHATVCESHTKVLQEIAKELGVGE